MADILFLSILLLLQLAFSFFAVNKVCKIGYPTVSVFGVVYGLYVQNRFKSILDNISLTMCRLNISIENKALNIQFI